MKKTVDSSEYSDQANNKMFKIFTLSLHENGYGKFIFSEAES